MKLTLFSLLFTTTIFAAPEVILAPVDHLYIPKGFDSNDSVEVVVTGTFPNVCYSRNSVNVRLRGEEIDIEVTALAPEQLGKLVNEKFCAEMEVPFKEVISLGNLQGGDYKVNVNQEAKISLSEVLTVSEATSSAVDDNVYAAVDYVEQLSDKDFNLKGWKYSNCFEVKEIKIVSNKKDTFSILPIMKQVSTHCPMKGMPFTYPVKLNLEALQTKRPLLHVRTLDGKSVNSIVNMDE
jgi:hypothetical protein